MMVDSHIHLSHFSYNGEFPYLSFEDGNYVIRCGTREQLIETFKLMGIEYCVEPAIDIESNSNILSLAERFPGFLFSAVGVHPSRTYQYKTVDQDGKAGFVKLSWKQRRRLRDFLAHPSVVAIGETGLDYHLIRNEQHRFRQKQWFVFQLKLAYKHNLPVILHIREADVDAIRILKKYKHYLHGGVCHCFNGSIEVANIYTQLGLKLGIGGALLMNTPKKQDLEQVIIQTPLESIILETDGPYVKPDCPTIQKKQILKARNTSLIIPQIAQRISDLKGVPPEEVLKITSENAIMLFGLKNMTT